MSGISWSDVPDEIQAHILSFLPPSVVLTVSLVSRQMHSVATSDDVWLALLKRDFPLAVSAPSCGMLMTSGCSALVRYRDASYSPFRVGNWIFVPHPNQGTYVFNSDTPEGVWFWLLPDRLVVSCAGEYTTVVGSDLIEHNSRSKKITLPSSVLEYRHDHSMASVPITENMSVQLPLRYRLTSNPGDHSEFLLHMPPSPDSPPLQFILWQESNGWVTVLSTRLSLPRATTIYSASNPYPILKAVLEPEEQ